MTSDPRARADARLDAALDAADYRDPRPFYRGVLKHLRQYDADAFRTALDYYEQTLVPAVAGEADPLDAWLDYGRVLARALGDGRLVELDSTGRARPTRSVTEARGLVFYIPDAPTAPVLVLRYPRETTPAQHAAYELLVEGRQTASAYE